MQDDQIKKHSHVLPGQGNAGDQTYALGSLLKSDTQRGTSEVGGTETRPKNAAVAYLIKY